MHRRALPVAALVAAALLPGCLSGFLGAESAPAPDFRLTTVDGRNVTLADYAGKVLLLDFMATTCEPCKDVSRDLARLAAEDPEVAVLSISIDPTEEDALRRWKETHNATWDHALDTGQVFRAYEGRVIPYLVVVDEQGTIRGRASGSTDYAKIAGMVRTAKVLA